MRIVFFIFLYLTIFQSSFAQDKQAIFFGGACDEVEKKIAKNYSILPAYEHFKESANSLKERGWDVDLKMGKESTKAQLLHQLDKAITSAETGGLKQLLVGTLTHGTEKTQEQPHSICIDYDEKKNKEIWMNIDDAEFTKKLQRLKDLKVEIGFIDGSCFSGGSIESLKQYGCVISSQASHLPTAGAGIFQSINQLGKHNKVSLSHLWRDSLTNNSYSSANKTHMFPQNSDHITGIEDSMGVILHYANYKVNEMFTSEKQVCDIEKIVASNLLPLLDFYKKISTHLLEREYVNDYENITSEYKTFLELQDIVRKDALLLQEKINQAEQKRMELENLRKNYIFKYSIDDKFLADLANVQMVHFLLALKKLGVHFKLDSQKVEMDINRILGLSETIDYYQKNIPGGMETIFRDWTGDEMLDVIFFAKKINELVTIVPAQDFAIIKQHKTKDEKISKDLRGLIKEMDHEDLKNRLGKNIKQLLKFVSRINEALDQRGNCARFKL